MFVGKWQPFHEGHRWLIEERLKLKKNILIGIRETENPSYSPNEIKMQVSKLYPNEVKDGKIKFIEITGRPNQEVLELISTCDFVIDQLYSDMAMVGFATEAAFFGWVITGHNK